MVASANLPAESPTSYHHLSDDGHVPVHSSMPRYEHEQKEQPVSSRSSSTILTLPPSVAVLPAAPSSFGSEYDSKCGDEQLEHKYEEWTAHKDDKHEQLLRDHNIDYALAVSNQTAADSFVTTTDLEASANSSSYSALSIESAPEEQVPPFPWVMVMLIASINLNDAFQQNCIWSDRPRPASHCVQSAPAANADSAADHPSASYVSDLCQALHPADDSRFPVP